MSRKITLTVILSFISPGSASQVVAGLALSFVVLLVNIYLKPFVTPSLNHVNQASHTCTFLFFLTGLLLKVNVDGHGNSGAFSAIVSVLCIAPVILPAVLPFILQLYTAMVTKGKPSVWSRNSSPDSLHCTSQTILIFGTSANPCSFHRAQKTIRRHKMLCRVSQRQKTRGLQEATSDPAAAAVLLYVFVSYTISKSYLSKTVDSPLYNDWCDQSLSPPS